jgi:DNA-binding transcriptional LysR family regulator
MVAAGLGVTVLPSYSVFGDPLEQRGAITARELADDDTGVRLVVQRRRSTPLSRATRDLHKLFASEARAYAAAVAKG